MNSYRSVWPKTAHTATASAKQMTYDIQRGFARSSGWGERSFRLVIGIECAKKTRAIKSAGGLHVKLQPRFCPKKFRIPAKPEASLATPLWHPLPPKITPTEIIRGRRREETPIIVFHIEAKTFTRLQTTRRSGLPLFQWNWRRGPGERRHF